jgi:hypothetical protein
MWHDWPLLGAIVILTGGTTLGSGSLFWFCIRFSGISGGENRRRKQHKTCDRHDGVPCKDFSHFPISSFIAVLFIVMFEHPARSLSPKPKEVANRPAMEVRDGSGSPGCG